MGAIVAAVIMGAVALYIFVNENQGQNIQIPGGAPPPPKRSSFQLPSSIANKIAQDSAKDPTLGISEVGAIVGQSPIPDSTDIKDVSFDIDDTEYDWFEDDIFRWVQATSLANINSGHGGKYTLHQKLDADAVTDRFYRQMHLPASRYAISDLGKADFAIALKLLTHQVDYKSYRRTDSEQCYYNFLDSGVWTFMDVWSWIAKIFGYIVPIFGAIEAIVDAIVNDTGAFQGIDIGSTSYGDQLQAKIKASVAAADVATKTYLQNALTFGSPIGILTATTDLPGPAEEIQEWISRAHLWANMQSVATDGTKFRALPFQPIPYKGVVAQSNQLFAFYGGLRWNCTEVGSTNKLKGDKNNQGLKERTNNRAKIYRALDVIRCIMYPTPPTKDSGLYSYVSPIWGTLEGSVFPPTPGEDTPPVIQRAATTVADVVKVVEASTKIQIQSPLLKSTFTPRIKF